MRDQSYRVGGQRFPSQVFAIINLNTGISGNHFMQDQGYRVGGQRFFSQVFAIIIILLHVVEHYSPKTRSYWITTHGFLFVFLSILYIPTGYHSIHQH